MNVVDQRLRFAGKLHPIRIERLRQQRAIAHEQQIAVGVHRARVDRQRHLLRGAAVDRSDAELVTNLSFSTGC